MFLRTHNLLMLLMVFAVLTAGQASASREGAVSGSVLYGMGNYRVEGEEEESIRNNYMQAELRYTKEGLLGDKRLGKYTLMLGYEFSTLTPEVVSAGVKDPMVERIVTRKPLYEASILLAPGGLPFRFSGYARDLHRTSFVEESKGSYLGGSEENFYDTNNFTGVNNGTHREIGGTLLLGIRNGTYLGLYRDVLSQLPRLLIDYKEVEVNDLTRDSNQQHYRARDLAFISLNKKDNWLHLRMHDFTDYLRPESNYTDSQVIIGTIDQNMSRQWINLTNWLMISGDLSYIVKDDGAKPAADRSYVINLMGVGRHDGLSISLLPGFARMSNGSTVNLESHLPINLSVDLNRDTNLRSHFSYSGSQVSLYEGGESSFDPLINVETMDRNFYLDTSMDLWRSRQVIVRPRIELESQNDSRVGDGLALRVGSEFISNNSRDKSLRWLAGYALTAINTTAVNSEENNTYLEHKITGRIDKDLSRSLRIGANGFFATGNGKERNTLSFRIPVISNTLQVGSGSGGGASVSADRVTNGFLGFYLDHHYRQIDNYLTLDLNFLITGGETLMQKSLRHQLLYTEVNHRLKWTSSLNVGDNTGEPETIQTEYLANESNTSNDVSVSWHTDATYVYTPDRSTTVTLSSALSGADAINFKAFEKIAYRIFTTNGIIRRLAEFSEDIGYEETGMNSRGAVKTMYGRLGAAYYPTKYLYGKIRTEINTVGSGSALQHLSGAEIGADFKKLQVTASYNEGRRERQSDELPAVVERFWNFKVKKIF